MNVLQQYRMTSNWNRWEPLAAGTVIIFSVCLMVVFSLGPIFEGPDEIEHYRYVRTLIQTDPS